MSETAVLFCGHGGRDPKAITEFETFATALRPHLPDVDLATITSSSRGRRSMSERVDEFESGEPTMNCHSAYTAPAPGSSATKRTRARRRWRITIMSAASAAALTPPCTIAFTTLTRHIPFHPLPRLRGRIRE
jgi:hypothetical protein